MITGSMVSEAAGCATTRRPLTRSLDLTERQAAVQATRPCSVEDCSLNAFTRGMCSPHYQRWRRYGTTTSLRIPRVGRARMRARWRAMIRRCHDPNDKSWPRYGGRGIVVCPEWRVSLDAYYADIGDPPFERASLDRIDNDGPYAPWNVKWATYREQVYNRPRVNQNADRTCCQRGHPFDESNTQVSGGQRACRECARARNAKSRARRRADDA